jgi:tungstate transport system ATP-binding protein
MKLSLDHIRKSYDGRQVLTDCSFSFPESSVSVLMGPNGCGKSTLLRICALLEQPDGGELQYRDNGSPLPQDLPLRRRMTLVLPRTGVFSTTVFENVAYGLRVRDLRTAAIEEIVRSSLSFVGLEHKLLQHARTLSSGETQRMGIARALAVGPEVLFLDEPTASVDEENTAIIESIILKIQKERLTTVIMTTHDREQAERMADVLLFMKHGAIEPLFTGPQ